MRGGYAPARGRGDFIPSIADDEHGGPPAADAPPRIENDPAIVAELIGRSEASLAALKRDIATTSGSALLDFILADIRELKRHLSDPLSVQAIMAGMEAAWWLNAQLDAWLGEKNAADALTQSAPGNVTSEMGLALLDVADAIRPRSTSRDRAGANAHPRSCPHSSATSGTSSRAPASGASS